MTAHMDFFREFIRNGYRALIGGHFVVYVCRDMDGTYRISKIFDEQDYCRAVRWFLNIDYGQITLRDVAEHLNTTPELFQKKAFPLINDRESWRRQLKALIQQMGVKQFYERRKKEGLTTRVIMPLGDSEFIKVPVWVKSGTYVWFGVYGVRNKSKLKIELGENVCDTLRMSDMGGAGTLGPSSLHAGSSFGNGGETYGSDLEAC